MSQAPLISVIIPVYNAENFIQESIDSILTQTMSNFKLILVNDRSTDSTPQILEANAEQDERILVLHNKENMHISGATNVGLEHVDTPYIALMDHDDISLPDRFEKEYNYLEANPETIVVGGNIEKFGSLTGANRLPTDPAYIDCSMFFSLLFENTTLMMRSDFIKEHNLRYNSEFDLCQDYDILERISHLKPGSITNLSDVLVRKRFFENNSSLNALDTHFMRVQKVFKRVRERMFGQDRSDLAKLHANMWAPKSQNLNSDELIATLGFIESLIAENSRKKLYPVETFSSYCAECYFYLLKEMSKKKENKPGLHCIFRYIASSLKKHYAPSVFEQLKLTLRCL